MDGLQYGSKGRGGRNGEGCHQELYVDCFRHQTNNTLEKLDPLKTKALSPAGFEPATLPL